MAGELPLAVSAGFDQGRSEVIAAERAGDIRVRLVPDHGNGPVHGAFRLQIKTAV